MENPVSRLLTPGARAEVPDPEETGNRIRKIAGEPEKTYWS